MTLDKLFLALHVLGDFMWIGGLFTVLALLEVHAVMPEGDARTKVLQHTRTAAIVPDVGATLAIVFGLHWLFKYKLYEVPYMHAKLACVAAILVLHVIIRRRVRRAKTGQPSALPTAIKGVMTLLLLAILTFVLAKWPL